MIFLFSLLFCFALSGQRNVITWASDAHLHVLSNLNFEIAVCTFRFGFPSIELLESLYESAGRPVYKNPDHSFDRQRTHEHRGQGLGQIPHPPLPGMPDISAFFSVLSDIDNRGGPFYSSNVEISPTSRPNSWAFSNRRMILPLRVFGSVSGNAISAGTAMPPKTCLTCGPAVVRRAWVKPVVRQIIARVARKRYL